MSAVFLGSGSEYLDKTFEPVGDRLDEDCYEDYDELETNSDDDTDVSTLDEVGYSFGPFGGLILHSKKEKVEAVFKKRKLSLNGTQQLADDECNICMMPTDASELVMTSCNHRYCRDCLSYYLSLESGDIANLSHTKSRLELADNGKLHLRIHNMTGIRCPHPHCEHVIEGEEFTSLVDEKTHERFTALSLVIALNRLIDRGELKRCRSKACDGYIQDCKCTSKACHRKHLNKLRMEDQRLFGKWAKAYTRKCPNCGVLTEKNGGCSHMYCTKCKLNYDWTNSRAVY